MDPIPITYAIATTSGPTGMVAKSGACPRGSIRGICRESRHCDAAGPAATTKTGRGGVRRCDSSRSFTAPRTTPTGGGMARRSTDRCTCSLARRAALPRRRRRRRRRRPTGRRRRRRLSRGTIAAVSFPTASGCSDVSSRNATTSTPAPAKTTSTTGRGTPANTGRTSGRTTH